MQIKINIQGDARKFVFKDYRNNIVFTIPIKLPKIIKPKPSKLINGEILQGGVKKGCVLYSWII